VLWECLLHIERGEVVTLLGANGAGKPRSCARFRASCDSTSKTITLDGVDIAKAPSHDVANVEIAHIREGRNLRPEMTVEEHDSQCRAAPRPSRRSKKCTRFFRA
jgi:branched-chain amino acid transport system ATP-binding protein